MYGIDFTDKIDYDYYNREKQKYHMLRIHASDSGKLVYYLLYLWYIGVWLSLARAPGLGPGSRSVDEKQINRWDHGLFFLYLYFTGKGEWQWEIESD